MLVKITAYDLEGYPIIDDSLYETIAMPRIGEYIMAHPVDDNDDNDYYCFKVVRVVHKCVRRNSKKDFIDRDIQVFCELIEFKD